MDATRADGAEDAAAGSVTVRFWAAAKQAAGRAEERVSADTVGAALAIVRDRHADNPSFARVLAQCSLLVDGEPVGTRPPDTVALHAGATVEVLPPFAGG